MTQAQVCRSLLRNRWKRMPEGGRLCLEESFKQRTIPYRLIGDFKSEELLRPPKGCKIFISHGVVYSHSGENPPHTRTHTKVKKKILDSLVARYGEDNIVEMTSTTLNIMNINGCHPSFGKIPDAIVGVYNGSTNVETPVIAVK